MAIHGIWKIICPLKVLFNSDIALLNNCFSQPAFAIHRRMLCFKSFLWTSNSTMFNMARDTSNIVYISFAIYIKAIHKSRNHWIISISNWIMITWRHMVSYWGHLDQSEASIATWVVIIVNHCCSNVTTDGRI